MPQVSLYIEQELLDTVRKNAKSEKLSVSKYVSKALSEKDEYSWPEGYWDLFGSLDDDTFVCPEDVPFDQIPDKAVF